MAVASESSAGGLNHRDPDDPRLVFLGATTVGDISSDTVGAKAANLMRMAGAGLAVPAGFVVFTQVCADYHASGGRLDPDVTALVTSGVQHIEQATGLRFGATRRPLLVAVQSGAAVSMPRMHVSRPGRRRSSRARSRPS